MFFSILFKVNMLALQENTISDISILLLKAESLLYESMPL